MVATATLLRNGTPVGASIQSSPIPTLSVGGILPLVFTDSLPVMDGPGTWTVRYALSAAESVRETTLVDNETVAGPVLIGGPELSRYDGPVIASLGIGTGTGTGGEVGSEFDLPVASAIVGLHFEMKPVFVDDMNPDNWTGRTVFAHLRAFNTVTGKPGEVIATTQGVATTLEGGKYDLPFQSGTQLLPAGRYVATVAEPIGGQGMPLPGHRERFYPRSTWAIWPGIPTWAHLEDFGSSFRVMPQVSILLGLEMFRDGLE